MGQNRRSLPQELEVGSRSGQYLLVLIMVNTGDEDNIVVCDDSLRPGAGPHRPTGQPELVIPPSLHSI